MEWKESAREASIPEANDQDHDRQHLTHVIEVAAHHQQLSQSQADENHFAGNQRPPVVDGLVFRTVERRLHRKWGLAPAA